MIRSLLSLRVDRAIMVVGACLVVAYLAAMTVMRKPDGRVVFGDATHHFVQLRSIVFDRDLDFRNEYIRLYGLQGEVPGTEWIYTDLTSTGHVRNYMPVGPALLWAPLYILVAAIQTMLSWVGVAAKPDGFDRALQLVPGITGILAATMAAWLAWRIALSRTSSRAAGTAVFGVWLGSHALYYSLASPSYSHTASMLMTSIFLASWLSTRGNVSIARLAWWGALCGFAALMRWQDALFMAVPLIEAARWTAPLGRRVAGAMAAGVGFVLAFSPQMVVWTVLYGQPLALPQGPSFMHWTDPHPFLLLFSDSHGLFTWAPILVPAAIGLIVWLRREPAVALPITVVLLASWYTNAAVADWWAGEAFGARRFLSLFPLFVVGLAVWLQPRASEGVRSWRLAVVGVLGVMNALLLLQYELVMKGLLRIAPYPYGWYDMWFARFAVPIRLLREWLS
ncbi:MAG: hypothetical protein ABI634_00845 [Acidobacteriota bacterium]